MTTAHTATPLRLSKCGTYLVTGAGMEERAVAEFLHNGSSITKTDAQQLAAKALSALQSQSDLVKALQAARLYAHGIGQATTIDLIEKIDAALAKAGAA